MRALVVGGGVAGPATALALHRAGFDVEVLERRAADPGDAGSVLTLAPNGVDALDALGVLDRVRADAVPSRRNAMYGATGRLLGTVTLGRPIGRRHPRPDAAPLAAGGGGAPRRRGRPACGRGTAPACGRSTSRPGRSPSRTGPSSRPTSSSGPTACTRWSARRSTPAAPAPRYVGLWNFGGDHARERAGRRAGARAVALRLRPSAPSSGRTRRPPATCCGSSTSPDLCCPATRGRRGRRRSGASTWSTCSRSTPGPAAELVRGGELELAADMTYDLGHVPTWWRDRAVLVGDAAHAPSPSSGQGAAMALEDAVVLADAIAAAPDLAAGLAAYEQRRRARVERIVKAGARSSSSRSPAASAGCSRRPCCAWCSARSSPTGRSRG